MSDRRMRPLTALKQRIYPAVARHLSHAMLVEGALARCGLPLRCLFLDAGDFTDYLRARIYAGPVRTLAEGKVWNPLLPHRVAAAIPQFDLCVAVLDRTRQLAPPGLHRFAGGTHVHQVIDTSAPWETIRGRFHRKKRELSGKLTTKHGLACRISNSADDFDLYYRRMYLPLIRRQFGDLAVIDPYENARQRFRNGFLLLVTRDGRPVAGSLCFAAGRTLKFHAAGVLDADDSHIRAGAQMALYYFQLRLAESGAFDALDVGRSRPLLDDGVYRTKREWGAEVRADDGADQRVLYLAPRLSRPIAHLFAENPIIVQTGEGLKGVVGHPGDDLPGDGEKREFIRRFSAPGLTGLHLITPCASAPIDLPFPGAASPTAGPRSLPDAPLATGAG